MLLCTSVKEVHEPDLIEHERQNCPKSFNLDAVAQGVGEARLPSATAATGRRLSAARRCRSPHADGAVAEEIDTIEHSIRVINVVYIVLYAFTAHDRRRGRVARARQPAVRGHVVIHRRMASQLRREPLANVGSSRRVASWHCAWCSSSHTLPLSCTIAPRRPFNRRACRAVLEAPAKLCVAQEVLIEERGIVPSNAKSPSRAAALRLVMANQLPAPDIPFQDGDDASLLQLDLMS